MTNFGNLPESGQNGAAICNPNRSPSFPLTLAALSSSQFTKIHDYKRGILNRYLDRSTLQPAMGGAAAKLHQLFHDAFRK